MSTVTDIVERLRAGADQVDRACRHLGGTITTSLEGDAMREAADEIERLRKVEAAMRGVAHAWTVPNAGDGHPGILVQKRHSDFVGCPVCTALYEWGTASEPRTTAFGSTDPDSPKP